MCRRTFSLREPGYVPEERHDHAHTTLTCLTLGLCSTLMFLTVHCRLPNFFSTHLSRHTSTLVLSGYSSGVAAAFFAAFRRQRRTRRQAASSASASRTTAATPPPTWPPTWALKEEAAGAMAAASRRSDFMLISDSSSARRPPRSTRSRRGRLSRWGEVAERWIRGPERDSGLMT
ncbi:hypothetical protein EYF80_063252 [Liparis tanakae]|uniref:Uncharacterized protein n=1 Tax=Liparis tanakae TaxID=230148 RepID=A0A4Z2EEA6_9TELE|nr:hypothetical protein EYF80_063252 [Liparis tanakae]